MANPLRSFQRRKEVPDLVKDLVSIGVDDPDTINLITEEFVSTGKYSLPARLKTRVPAEGPALPGGQDPEAIVPGEPVRLGRPTVLINQDTGAFDMPARLQGGVGLGGIRYNPRAGAGRGEAKTFFYDPETGNVIRSAPRAGSADQYIRIGKKAAGGDKKALTAQEKIDLFTLQTYQRALIPDRAGNSRLTDELARQAVAAAKRLNLPTYQTSTSVEIPGLAAFLERLVPGGETGFEDISEETPLSPPEDLAPPPARPAAVPPPPAAPAPSGGQGDEAFQRDLQRAQLAVSQGLVTPEEADKRLKSRYGRGL